jgi:hypothetical protein
MKWIRDVFKGPLIVKGVQNREDARRAIDCGASAVVVSNRRGRSLRPGRPSVTGTLRLRPSHFLDCTRVTPPVEGQNAKPFLYLERPWAHGNERNDIVHIA